LQGFFLLGNSHYRIVTGRRRIDVNRGGKDGYKNEKQAQNKRRETVIENPV
jgi:hypothetical protein